jgi:hypothetical protein
MKTNPDVERWFSERKPPAEQAMRRVREIIVQTAKKNVNVMFNRAAPTSKPRRRLS